MTHTSPTLPQVPESTFFWHRHPAQEQLQLHQVSQQHRKSASFLHLSPNSPVSVLSGSLLSLARHNCVHCRSAAPASSAAAPAASAPSTAAEAPSAAAPAAAPAASSGDPYSSAASNLATGDSLKQSIDGVSTCAHINLPKCHP